MRGCHQAVLYSSVLFRVVPYCADHSTDRPSTAGCDRGLLACMLDRPLRCRLHPLQVVDMWDDRSAVLHLSSNGSCLLGYDGGASPPPSAAAPAARRHRGTLSPAATPDAAAASTTSGANTCAPAQPSTVVATCSSSSAGRVLPAPKASAGGQQAGPGVPAVGVVLMGAHATMGPVVHPLGLGKQQPPLQQRQLQQPQLLPQCQIEAPQPLQPRPAAQRSQGPAISGKVTMPTWLPIAPPAHVAAVCALRDSRTEGVAGAASKGAAAGAEGAAGPAVATEPLPVRIPSNAAAAMSGAAHLPTCSSTSRGSATVDSHGSCGRTPSSNDAVSRYATAVVAAAAIKMPAGCAVTAVASGPASASVAAAAAASGERGSAQTVARLGFAYGGCGAATGLIRSECTSMYGSMHGSIGSYTTDDASLHCTAAAVAVAGGGYWKPAAAAGFAPTAGRASSGQQPQQPQPQPSMAATAASSLTRGPAGIATAAAGGGHLSMLMSSHRHSKRLFGKHCSGGSSCPDSSDGRAEFAFWRAGQVAAAATAAAAASAAEAAAPAAAAGVAGEATAAAAGGHADQLALTTSAEAVIAAAAAYIKGDGSSGGGRSGAARSKDGGCGSGATALPDTRRCDAAVPASHDDTSGGGKRAPTVVYQQQGASSRGEAATAQQPLPCVNGSSGRAGHQGSPSGAKAAAARAPDKAPGALRLWLRRFLSCTRATADANGAALIQGS